MPVPGPAPLAGYDAEADAHDATRGGAPHAEAAAAAVLGLLPPTARTLLDVGCGTGVVTTRLTRPGPRWRPWSPRPDGCCVPAGSS
ncbi:hypothetical protein ACIGQE_16685 [Streptomyces sp. NPDC053429]|uniref:hypothetical protein n=1 Tax=Streptomyces sp. NPDC053429 TaxID=3365702 RepID=UPI0037D2E2DE